MAACGCPGISYLNTYKREILLLNIGISALMLSLNVGEDEWLMTEVISGSMQMKAITAAINEYGLELLNSIEALQH